MPLVHYRLVILQMDGVTKVTAVRFDDIETAEYHAQLLSKSAGIEEVTIIECRDYLTLDGGKKFAREMYSSLGLG